MALKFLNKKGWHTGSLRNIENVWKAEQKHEAEQKKLEELRKQIHEERERSEFRLLQEQAGLVPKQERLDFLYDSGLAVGKGGGNSSSDGGFKSLQSLPSKTDPTTDTPSSSSTKQQQPGALFEEKPQSANDAWRKLHSDPLLLIRQREQEALARVKNNPIQMAMIRKSVEAKKHKEKPSNGKERPEKHHHHQKKSSRHRKHESHQHHLDSEDVSTKGEEERNKGHYRVSKNEERSYKAATAAPPYSEDESSGRDTREKRKNSSVRDLKYKERSPSSSALRSEAPATTERRGDVQPGMGRRDQEKSESHHKRRNNAASKKLSEEERAARLREMQMDAEVHEEQRWKRLRKAEEDDAREITRADPSGRNFLDAAHKSVYGADKGGSSTIEESVRRRTHYSQGRTQVGDAFVF
ncbi:hypothetical protein LguiA_015239 [Lonicera macranthoides]